MQSNHAPPRASLLPHQPVRRWTRPLLRFLEIEAASGVLLLLCTVAALALANSSWAQQYHDFWHTYAGVTIGSWTLKHSLVHWVNDGLMTIFFFTVGLEIKREIVTGELRELRKASLPVMAALGGMVAPALIYLSLQYGQPGARGWGIPMATDIAFVVGFLVLLGKRVPLGLKIMLLALAIADDIGAVLVIALFYSTDLSLTALGAAGFGLLLTLVWQRVGVRQVGLYVLLGAAIWLAFIASGIHPTIAGVLLGLLTPSAAWISTTTLTSIVDRAMNRLQESPDWEDAPDRTFVLDELQTASLEATSPLERLQHALHPWVAFGIMPVFALANAGVAIEAEFATSRVALAVALGLVVGKPLGIFVFSWLAVKLGIARLPTGVNWAAVFGGGCLAGIGFTMSLFVAGLALQGDMLEAGKLGTLMGSTVSAILGCVILLFSLRKPAEDFAHSDTLDTQPEELSV